MGLRTVRETQSNGRFGLSHQVRRRHANEEKNRVETALKILSTMSPAEVQQRLNAEDLSTPIVSVKPKTQKKESTKKKLELVSPRHTYRRTVEEERRRQMFEFTSIEGDDNELPVSQKRSLPAKSGPKKKAGLPKAPHQK